jgi:hypothetical protein
MLKKFFRIFLFIAFSNQAMAAENFSINTLSNAEIEKMVADNVLQKPDFFDPQRLRLLHISYHDFDGKIHNDGKIIVLDAAAENVLEIFKKLFEKKFPIHQMKLMNEFKGNDDLALNANNSSALNQRKIAGSDKISIHSYGLAIDINPIQNPFISFENGAARFSPESGKKFANRKINEAGLVEDVVQIFYENGFNIWGGNWKEPIDYQHFQTSRKLAELLVMMNEVEAKEFFKLHVRFLKNHKEEIIFKLGDNPVEAYLSDRDAFLEKAKRIK